MSEKFEPTKNSEKVEAPSEAEVMGIIESQIEGRAYTIDRRLEDSEGLYLLEVRIFDEKGEIVEYSYTRANNNPIPACQSSKTVIDVIYYSGDMPREGKRLSVFENGIWSKVE